MATTHTDERTGTRWFSCADTAKLIRKALKERWPRVKFSVRSDVYSGGASIDVRYTDGPRTKDVEAVTNFYRASDFDGSIDLRSDRWHYLTPAGELVKGGTHGTVGSLGYIEAEQHPIPIGSVKVHLGANHIFVERDYSSAAEQMILARAAQIEGRCPTMWNARCVAGQEFDFTPVLEGRKPSWRPKA